MLIHFHAVQLRHDTTAELSHGNKDCMTHKAKILYLASTRKCLPVPGLGA